MKILNKPTLIFLFVIFVLFFGIYQFLQSPKVAELVSKRISETVFKKEGIKINFKKVDMDLFPPTTYLNEVSIYKSEKGGVGIEMEAKRVGFHFGFLDFFSNQFIISKISITDAVTEIKLDQEKFGSDNLILDELKKLTIESLLNDYKTKIYRERPIIREILLDEIRVTFGDSKFLLDQLNLKLFKRSFTMSGRLEEFSFLKLADWVEGEQEIVFDFNLKKDLIEISDINIKNREDRIWYKGNITQGKNNLVTKGNLRMLGRVENFSKTFNFLRKEKELSGLIDAKAKVTKNVFNPDVSLNAKLWDLKTRYEDVSYVNIKTDKVGDSLTVNEVRIEEGQSELSLREKILIPNLNKIDFEKIVFALKFISFPTDVALYYVKALKPIKGRFSGLVDVFVVKKDIHFKVHKNFHLNDFQLRFPGSDTPLLINKRVTSNGGEVIVKENGDVHVDFDFAFPNSRLIIGGAILESENRMAFSSKEGTIIDFEKFGPIAGIQLHGKGPIKMEVSGPIDDVTLSFFPEINDFSLLGFKFGNAKGSIDYKINQDRLVINSLNSIFGLTEIQAKGEFIFSEDPQINLELNNPRATYLDSLKIYETLTKDLKFLPDDLAVEYNAQFKLTGPLDLKRMTIEGEIKGDSNPFYFERIEGFKAKFKFQNNKINISDVFVNEGKGIIKANFSFDLKNEDFDYKGSIKDMRVSDVEIINLANLGFDGVFSGKFEGVRKNKKLKTNAIISIINSTIGDEKVSDSKIVFTSDGDKIFSDGQMIGKKIYYTSFFNLDKKDAKNLSFINFHLKTDKVREFLGLLSTHNMVDEGLEGSAILDFSSSFNLSDIKKLSANLNFKTFKFRKGESRLNLDEEAKEIFIEDGVIKKWDLKLKDKENLLTFIGEGKLYDKFTIATNYSIDADILKILTPRIKRIAGKTEGNIRIFGNKEKVSTSIFLGGVLEKLGVAGVPNYFEDLQLQLSLENKDLLVQKFKGRYGKGEVDISGNVNLDYPKTGIYLDYSFSNLKIPIMNLKKSNLLLSGRGSLDGKGIPYDLTGKYSITYGDLRNEINEYYPSAQESTFYEKYLPKELTKKMKAVVNYDLTLDITSPIELKNSIAEVFFDGKVSVTGNNENPILNGFLKVIPEQSKVVFKSNEFKLLEGKLEFINSPDESPNMKFVGESMIKEYNVKFGLEGRTNKLSINLESDPFLPQEDILSLLTLGITSQDAMGLKESERQAVTSVGLGALLADQLKINQGLSSGLGLRLSVIPEVEEETEVVTGEGREGAVNPYPTQYKSATSVQVKKQITNSLDLSIASTVGGSIDQKQRMSADYYINKHLSFEGVYELKTRQDSNISNITNAFGADLIFRWSFK